MRGEMRITYVESKGGEESIICKEANRAVWKVYFHLDTRLCQLGQASSTCQQGFKDRCRPGVTISHRHTFRQLKFCALKLNSVWEIILATSVVFQHHYDKNKMKNDKQYANV